MNLFEVDAEILEKCIDMETGEIVNEELLNELEMEKSKKLLNIGRWIKNLESDTEQLKAQEQAFKERRAAAERKIDSLKKYLAAYLNGQKWESDDCSVAITFRKSESVNVLDESIIPTEYIKTKTETTVDKAGIKKALKEGKVIEGAELVANNNIQIK